VRRVVPEEEVIVGCPTEIKAREHRVGLIPASVQLLASSGHKVLVQKDAGISFVMPQPWPAPRS
jgi:alanine dehydrogenase